MFRSRHPVAAAVTSLAVIAAVMATTATPASAATGPTVTSVLTTADHTHLMAAGASPVFDSNGTRPGQMITLDPTQKFQTMDGFGAAITDSSATLLYQLPAAQRTQVMTSIFSPTAGVGMSFLRQPIGASDMVSGPFYTFDDLAAGQTDLPMAHFSIAHDETEIIPLVKQALALNPSLKVLASPWSAPAWMKTGGSLIGGQLKNDTADIHAYALYLTKFIQAYQADGVPIYALTVQNEPQNREPAGYPGTDMPVATEVAVINQLGPMLSAAGLTTKIIAYDHNWTTAPNDITVAGQLGEAPETDYPYEVLNSSAAQYIAGTAYHCYNGDASAQTALHNAFPTKDIWFTECSGFHGPTDTFAKYFSDTLNWHAQNVELNTIKNWAKSVVNWNLALDSQGNPHNGGCGDSTGWCTGVIAINGTTVTYNAEYYALGHLSKYVKPGAVRIASNDTGDIHDVAFTNPDGSTVVYAVNTGGGTQTFGIAWNGMVVSYTMPPYAIATLTWPAGGTTVDTTPPTAPTGLAASGTTSSATTLKWMASTDNVGVTGYTVSRNGTVVGTSTGTTYTATGLAASTAYSFTVTAHDAAGNTSAVSNTVSVTTSAASGGGVPSAGVWYQVTTDLANKCLDDTGWSTSNGTALQQWTCSSPAATNQEWQFVPTANGYYEVINRNAANLSWDVQGGPGATGDGTQVQLWSYVGGTNQQWQPVALGGGYYKFVALNSGKCLDLRDLNTADGAWMQLWTCTGGPAQAFQLLPQS